ncbi:MAG: hypothetical protein ABS44_05110 [Chryseobacterium sp. SCN 40-13]|nr:MAG: hypothetical protein ABS44_05110 [Chryseobacterium sp. SCN 40-13]
MKKYLKETNILDYSDRSIQRIIEQRHWKSFDPIFRIRAIYNYVRDEIKFGYNDSNTLKSSKILVDELGNSNSKAILLMSFLRGSDIPCRIHGFIVDKSVLKGILEGIWFKLSPQKILHSSVEVFVDDDWYTLEGVMLDNEYINGLLKLKPDIRETFFAFELCEEGLEKLLSEKDLNDRFLMDRKEIEDIGVYESPDKLYYVHSQPFNPIKKFFFKNLVRHQMNKALDGIRKAD